jgi:hypothetical protein
VLVQVLMSVLVLVLMSVRMPRPTTASSIAAARLAQRVS